MPLRRQQTSTCLGFVAALLVVMPPAARAADQLGDERLEAGIYPSAPVPDGFAPQEPGHPPFDIDWSVGLRGSFTQATDGDSFVTAVTPAFTATHDGRAADVVIDGNAELSVPDSGTISITGLRLGISATAPLDSVTTLNGSAALTLEQELPDAPGQDALIITPPQIATGTVTAGVERQFGKLSVGLNGTAERTVYGQTERSDTGLTDNSDNNYWSTDASLRVAYRVTPIYTVYAEAGVGRDIFDQIAADTGVRADASDRTLEMGITGTWNSVLEASLSTGVNHRDFDSALYSDVTTQLYGASLTFSPDPTWQFTAGLDTTVAPAGPDNGGTVRVTHTATAGVNYAVNSWLQVRGSADWWTEDLVGTGETDTGFGFGVGADYALGAHTTLSADYGFGRRHDSTTGQIDSHEISLGLTYAR